MVQSLKADVCRARREATDSGRATPTWGTVRGANAGRTLAASKPCGAPHERLRPDGMPVGRAPTGAVVRGGWRPPSAATAHCPAFRRFARAGGVAHACSAHAMGFARSVRAILCLGTTHADGCHLPTPVTRPLTLAEVAADGALPTGRAIGERFADLDPGAVPGVPAACHGRFAGGADVAGSMRHAAPLAAVFPALPAPSINLGR